MITILNVIPLVTTLKCDLLGEWGDKVPTTFPPTRPGGYWKVCKQEGEEGLNK